MPVESIFMPDQALHLLTGRQL